MSPSGILASIARPKCSWCGTEFEEEALREVTFLGRRFLLCEEDFQLIWQGFAGLKALAEQFKTANASGNVASAASRATAAAVRELKHG